MAAHVEDMEYVSKKLFRRMNGTEDSGDKRTAGEAWAGGSGYEPPNGTSIAMDGNAWTTLAPAPIKDMACWPAAPAKGYGRGYLVCDTYLDATLSPNYALETSAGGEVYDKYWLGQGNAFMLGFDYKRSGATTVKAMAAWVISMISVYDCGQLDGDRVGPNGDDRSWSY